MTDGHNPTIENSKPQIKPTSKTLISISSERGGGAYTFQKFILKIFNFKNFKLNDIKL